MKKTEYPLRKNYEQDFLSEKGRKLFTLNYQQATMEEYHEFFALPETERLKQLYSIVHNQCPLSFMEKILSKIFKWYRGKIERWLNIEIILKNIVANRFRTYESIYSLPAGSKDAGEENLGIFSANLSIVCTAYCISPKELFDNFTVEQYIWLVDGVIFNANMAQEDGKYKNQRALVDREEVKRRAEATKRAFEEMERMELVSKGIEKITDIS